MRVVVAEDSTEFRRSLIKQLTEAGIQVVAAFDNGDAVVRYSQQDVPDAVILDIVMPPNDEGGLVAAEQLRRSQPDLGILILSAYADSDYAIRLLEPDPRATGYLLKDHVMDGATLREALERVARGGSYVDAIVIDRLTYVNPDHPTGKALKELSPQEARILRMLAGGRDNPYIIDALHISQKTLDSHLSNIYRKLQISSRPDYVRRVLAILKYLRAIRH